MPALLRRLWIVGLVMAPACGNGGPAKVTAPSLTNITVSGSDLLLIGQSETFTAVDNGGSAVTTATWGTDAPGVVAVESYTGRITAVGTGTATVFADLNGVRGTKSVRTLPNFAGSWSGLYQETACEATGDWAKFCVNDPWELGTAYVWMTLTQDRDTVSGRASLAAEPEAATGSGSISPDGTLTFTGIERSHGLSIEFTKVSFQQLQNGGMTGTFELLYTRPDYKGTDRVFAKIREMYRH